MGWNSQGRNKGEHWLIWWGRMKDMVEIGRREIVEQGRICFITLFD